MMQAMALTRPYFASVLFRLSAALLATSNLTIHPHSSARLASHNRLSYMHMTASESEACRLPSGVASILEAIHSFDTPPFEKGGF